MADECRRWVLAAEDGWLGTPDLPGYRAGNIVAQLDDLPDVDAHHLYFDLLLLDADGQLRDNHSGPCFALAKSRSIHDRCRFVRVVAELVRHISLDGRGLAGIGQALTLIRERGIENAGLVLAAQLIDTVCEEHVLVASLIPLLELSIGSDQAPRAMSAVVAELARESGFGGLDGDDACEPPADDVDSGIGHINRSGLEAQVSYVVRTVSKTHARRYLRRVIDRDLIPSADLLGV